ncbi:MAG: ATP-grasp domain-containing protein [bacterium]
MIDKKMKKAIVLGGTDDHIRLIETLQKKGYYTILIDYYPNPPAKKHADLHLQESILDKELVLEIAKKYNVKLVISACIDQALLTACYVSEKLRLPIPFPYNTALNVTNKSFMKKNMINSKIPTSKYISIKNIDGNTIERSGLKFPLVVKPSDSNGSNGVKILKESVNLISAFNEAKKISRSNEVIVEEFIEGIELSIDAVIIKGNVNVLMITQLNKYYINENTSIIFQSLTPADVDEKIKLKIESILNKIAKTFNLDNTPILMQVISNNDGVYVIEFSPRIGGGSKHKTIKTKTGYDILNASVDSFHGKDITFNKNPCEKYFSRIHLYAKKGVFSEIKFNGVNEEPWFENFILYKPIGTKINGARASRDRIGSIFISSNSKDNINKNINRLINRIEIIDENNRNIFEYKIYEKKEDKKYE